MRPPLQLKDPDIQRVVDDIYRILESLEKAVASPASAGGKASQTDGSSGNIRVVRGDQGQFHLEIRTEDGWARTNENVFEFGTRAKT